MPFGYSAIGGLLAQMDEAKRRMQQPLVPSSDAFQLPQQGVAGPPPTPAPPVAPPLAPANDPWANLANASVSDLSNPSHAHRRGIVGGLTHLLGADRLAPELAALLTPAQQQRAKPGLGTSLLGLIGGVTPSVIANARAGQMLGRQDELAKRNDAATLKEQMAALRKRAANGEIDFVEFAKQMTMLNPGLGGAFAGMLNATATEPAKPASPVANLSWIPDPTAPGGFRQLGSPAPKEPQYETFDGWRQMSTDGGKTWVKLGRAGTGSDASGDAALQRELTRAAPLSNSFQKETERHQVVAESLTTIGELREKAVQGDGAAQHMLVFAMMKLADPGSAVRQDERADTKNAANVPEQLRAMHNRFLGGGGPMSPNTVKAFLATVDGTKKARLKDFDSLVKRFETRAKLAKVNPSYVITDYFENVRDAGGAPKDAKKKLSPSDLAKAKTDPDFAAWARANGYEVP